MTDARKRQVTLTDVGRLAGVSRVVAGHVINGSNGNSRVSPATADRVWLAARKLGYSPDYAAQALRGVRTRTFGLLVASAGDPLTAFLVQYLSSESAKIGCQTLVCNVFGRGPMGPRQFEYWIEELARRRVDGVFCAVHNWFPRDRSLLLKRHPNTVFYEDPDVPGAAYVGVDREAATRLAVRHLAGVGRRRIALGVMTASRPTHLARRRGYEEELRVQGLPVAEDLIFTGEQYGVTFPVHNRASRRWEFATARMDCLIDQLVRDQGADAIVAHDDYWAAALVKRLRLRGLSVPADVAIVGYLNHYLADWVDPALTTIDPRHRVAARLMVRMLEKSIGGEKLPKDARALVIAPRLIVRESA